jgi:hypothetical protein
MKLYGLIVLLLFAACASRTKALDKLVGTHIEELLPKWDEPKKIMALNNYQMAYVFVYANVQSKGIQQAAGKTGIKFHSDISYVHTVITTNGDGTILNWDVQHIGIPLDSIQLLQVFNLNPR